MFCSRAWRRLAFLSLMSPWESSCEKHPNVAQNRTSSWGGHQFDINKQPCDKIPLTPALWSQLEMNAYLDNYGGGSRTSLHEYASEVGATDFSAGIGEHPHSGQLCEAVNGRDWYALVAAQNWNSFVNSLYDSAGYAFGIMSGIIPEMLIDFEKDPTRVYKTAASYVGLVTTWVSCFPGCIFSTWAPIASAMFDSLGEIAWISLVGVLYVSTSFAFINSVIFVGTGEDRFQRGADIATMMAQAQRAVQSTISNITQNVINSPINHLEGLAGINRDGSFLSEVPSNFQNNLQRELELALKLKSLAKFWRVQNAFVVRGSDPCVYSGVNGAYDDADMISYCGEDNIMMNIVRAEKNGNGYNPTIHHASLAESKYGYSSKFLTTLAWECQLKHGVFEYDWNTSHNSSTTNQSELRDLAKAGDCYFNLPVCDLTQPGLNTLRHNTSMTLTQICREAGGLPI
ncbi:hypothetical protein Pst134EA_027975 [Puccinia striiformis f. sp. tritici]|uniref:DUF7872 domain-containing protein n=1 Tax=Puccinia striiformis f. sp. tritici PST-78 TaxID=1165861 RepID=A0A0L0UWV3_9BASI|nr:hypothetical protein Pst134EA_027975 [Puccinia striiformis f. sp. tritici]KAH9448679.1 hypothetical protein Pst134EA_027975 [Puccinia striiformis f. sp. tritici]KAI9607896.1 hypothetical protein H4Q26_005346 [Puccinia striiformis f. sp. tritici PST-130]KNE91426.1 hypothetical protein PSTG_15173 [Puccinia striiformis f. sp. tritici PST-78]